MTCSAEEDIASTFGDIDIENSQETWAFGYNDLPYGQCSSFYQGGSIMSSFFEDGIQERFCKSESNSTTFNLISISFATMCSCIIM